MTDHTWRCDCGGPHFFAVTWWSDHDRDDTASLGRYLALEGDFRPPIRARLRTAWDVLWIGHADTTAGVVLTADKARTIPSVLSRYAASAAVD